MPQGLKAAEDTLKRKNMTSGSTGSHGGGSGASTQKRGSFTRGKQNKHFGSQSSGNFSGSAGGNQNNGNGFNNWGLRRSDASLWLSLINKLSKKSLLPVSLSIISTSISLLLGLEPIELSLICDFDTIILRILGFRKDKKLK